MDETRLAQAIVDALQSAQERSAAAGAAEAEREKSQAAIKAETEKRKELVKGILDHVKTLKDENALAKTVQKTMRGQVSEFVSNTEKIKELNKVLEKATTEEERLTILRTKRELELQGRIANTTAALSHFVKTVGTMVTAFAGGVKTLVGNLQDNASDFQTVSGIMTAGVDVVAGGAQSAGQGLSAAGSAAALAGGKLGKFGIGAVIAGESLSFLADNAGKLAKFGIEVLAKEAEKTVKAFNDSSSAGALFAGGAGAMRKAALEAGFTTDQFAAVVKGNSESLAQSGLGVTEGAKLIGRSMRLGGEATRTQLLKLGFSLEEQAGLYAETVADMRRTIGGRVLDADVVAQTQRYAENLRTIAAITGEDAKKKVAQVREQNQILAFQQQIAKLGPKQQAEINAAMANLDDMQQKNLRERLMYGGIVRSIEGNIYESQFEGAREKGEYIFRLLSTGQLTAEAVEQANVQFGKRINGSILAATDLGLAADNAGGVLGEVAKAGLKTLNENNIYTAENVDQARKNTQGQKETGDKFTNTIVTLNNQLQQLKLDFQNNLTGPMENFGRVATSITESLVKHLRSLGLVTGGETAAKEQAGGKVGSIVGEVAGSTAGGTVGGIVASRAIGAAVGGALGSVIPVAGTAIGMVAGGLIGDYVGTKIGESFGRNRGTGSADVPVVYSPEEQAPQIPGMATGGIVHGPKKVIAGENPRFPYEAFVPLPDNKTIPVTVKMIGTASETMTRPERYLGGAFGVGESIVRGLTSIMPSFVATLANPVMAFKDLADALAEKKAVEMEGVVAAGTVDMPQLSKFQDPEQVKVFKNAFAMANEPLVEALRQQNLLMQAQAEKIEKLIAVSTESKDINRQMLNNAY